MVVGIEPFQSKRQGQPLPSAPPWTPDGEKGAGNPCLRKGLEARVQKRLLVQNSR